MNVIKGSSDSGKSSIIRALLWSIENYPPGEEVKNWEAKKDDPIIVSIGLGDEYVEKRRANGKVVYILGFGEEPEESYTAVRSDVPEKIAEAFNLADYNIQEQHHPYFLLNDTPGQIAEKLNKLIDLEVIDRVFRNINSRFSGNRSKAASLSNEITALEKEIQKLAHIEAASIAVNELDESLKQKELVVAQCRILRDSITAADALSEQISSFNFFLEVEQAAKPLNADIEQFFKADLEWQNLSSFLFILDEVRANYQSWVDWLEIEIPYATLRSDLTLVQEKFKDATALRNIIQSAEAVQKALSTAIYSEQKQKQEYIKLLREAKVCPTCKSPIGNDVLKHIEEVL